MKNRAAFLLAFVLAFSAALFAGGSLMTADSYAADEYTYTVRIFAGNQGTIDGSDVKVYTGLKASDVVTFSPSMVSVSSSKYYVSGIRKSGADNYDPDNPQKSAITVTGDEDYVVAYGIAGKTAKYTVRYLDEDGNSLAAQQTFYGNVGDKPMVACEYIEGYYPQAYNLTKTISSNESENVFDFTYISTADTETVITQVQPGVVQPAAGAGAAAGDGAAAADGTAIGDNATPLAGPQDVVDLDDGSTPLADGSDIADSDTPAGLSTAGKAAIGVGAVALAALAAFLIARRRREYEYEDEE